MVSNRPRVSQQGWGNLYDIFQKMDGLPIRKRPHRPIVQPFCRARYPDCKTCATRRVVAMRVGNTNLH